MLVCPGVLWGRVPWLFCNQGLEKEELRPYIVGREVGIPILLHSSTHVYIRDTRRYRFQASSGFEVCTRRSISEQKLWERLLQSPQLPSGKEKGKLKKDEEKKQRGKRSKRINRRRMSTQTLFDQHRGSSATGWCSFCSPKYGLQSRDLISV